MDSIELKRRTKRFALNIIKLQGKLPTTKSADVIGRQVIRSGTSIGANYRAVCRARSRADFISKMGIVIEEADETLYWLELMTESGLMHDQQTEISNLMQEANELLSIFVASCKTARKTKGD